MLKELGAETMTNLALNADGLIRRRKHLSPCGVSVKREGCSYNKRKPDPIIVPLCPFINLIRSVLPLQVFN